MAFREPLNSMLWDETSVHTGLSWARIVLTFCRVWMSHTCTKNRVVRHVCLEQKRFMFEEVKVYRSLTMIVQSADPLYSLFLWRRNSIWLWLEMLDYTLWLMCVFAAHTPGYTKPTQCHHDPPEFSGICTWCRCPIPEEKGGGLRLQIT